MASLPTTKTIANYTLSSETISFVDQPAGGNRSLRVKSGHLWRIRADWGQMTQDEFMAIDAFLMSVGARGAFQLVLPERATPRGVATGTPIIRNRTNHLLWSNDFQNAVWTNESSGLTFSTGKSDPFGGTSATEMREAATSTTHGVYQNSVGTLAGSQSGSVYLNGGTRRYAKLLLWDITASTLVADVVFDLQSGTVLTENVGTGSIYPQPNQAGWYRCGVSGTSANAATRLYIRLYPGSGSDTYAGNTANYIYAYGAQIQNSSDPGVYVETTSSAISSGQSQSGTTLYTDGWTPSTTGILKAGDLIKTTNHAKVYQVTADVDSDAWGNATIPIGPDLMATPTDSEQLIVSDVPFTVALDSDIRRYDTQPPKWYRFSADMVEAI